jgi:hypothetical protein
VFPAFFPDSSLLSFISDKQRGQKLYLFAPAPGIGGQKGPGTIFLEPTNRRISKESISLKPPPEIRINRNA